MNLIETKVYAGRIKDKEILLKSSSGGAFTALSDYFLQHGDAVVSATYNYETQLAGLNICSLSQGTSSELLNCG